MKLFLVLITVVVMSLAMATCASAAALVSVDYLPSGFVEAPAVATDDDMSLVIIAAGGVFNRIKVGAEYGFGDVEGDDLTLWTAKLGYRVVDSTATKLDVVAAPLHFEVDGGSEVNATLLALDFTQYFSKQASLAITVGSAFEGELVGVDTEIPVFLNRLKFNYLVSDNWGLVLGYTKLYYDFDHPFAGRIDVTMGGYTLGALYRF